jgi:hypothetical protein
MPPTRATRLGSIASATTRCARHRAGPPPPLLRRAAAQSAAPCCRSELRAESRDSYACGRPPRGRICNATARLIRRSHLRRGAPSRRATGRRSTAEPAQSSGLSAFGSASGRSRPWPRACGQPGRTKDFAEPRPPVPGVTEHTVGNDARTSSAAKASAARDRATASRQHSALSYRSVYRLRSASWHRLHTRS